MGNRLRFTLGFRRRDVVLWLTLCSHAMVTFGFPSPAPSRAKSTDGVAYPCQSRPCGCITSGQCWAGDCCCFTLEEKVAWAGANGVTPPGHVRPLVESRRSRPAPAKKESCCSEAPPAAGPGVRWVAGVFAQKCRGEGAAGLFQLDPTLVPDVAPVALPEPDRDVHLPPRSERPAPLTHQPPTRPPRLR